MPSRSWFAKHGFHEGAFIFREALCLFVVTGDGEAFGIVGNVAAVGVISFDAGKTEQRHRDIARAFLTYPGKTGKLKAAEGGASPGTK